MSDGETEYQERSAAWNRGRERTGDNVRTADGEEEICNPRTGGDFTRGATAARAGRMRERVKGLFIIYPYNCTKELSKTRHSHRTNPRAYTSTPLAAQQHRTAFKTPTIPAFITGHARSRALPIQRAPSPATLTAPNFCCSLRPTRRLRSCTTLLRACARSGARSAEASHRSRNSNARELCADYSFTLYHRRAPTAHILLVYATPYIPSCCSLACTANRHIVARFTHIGNIKDHTDDTPQLPHPSPVGHIPSRANAARRAPPPSNAPRAAKYPLVQITSFAKPHAASGRGPPIITFEIHTPVRGLHRRWHSFCLPQADRLGVLRCCTQCAV
ncbi:hypothetical protein HYPSUDRAFT_210116 [Hypholoma sublateritium FD-334 SS-4]|uniref:Uncharacterized protein n=1 Tax=Hypholoma sublateritium (strain FD-334 SS-4) TaxID=945553 RepID=A0A0D2N0T3_HYPSF|nr:hypothetical protein HYPSUDRAFT_210116 [Hypholoma sublateritium FD-334 SS-4]